MAIPAVEFSKKYNSVIIESINEIKQINPDRSEEEIIDSIKNELYLQLIKSIINQKLPKLYTEREIQIELLRYQLTKNQFPVLRKEKAKEKIEKYEKTRFYYFLQNYLSHCITNEKTTNSTYSSNKFNYNIDSNQIKERKINDEFEKNRDILNIEKSNFPVNTKDIPNLIEEQSDIEKSSDRFDLDFGLELPFDKEQNQIIEYTEKAKDKINIDDIIKPIKHIIPKKLSKKEEIDENFSDLFDLIGKTETENKNDTTHDHDLM